VIDDSQDNGDEYWDDLFEWFDGECSPERATAIERWAQSDPNISQQVENEREHWERLKRAVSPTKKIDTLVSLRMLQRRRELLEHIEPAIDRARHRSLRIAAATVVAVAASGSIWWTGNRAGWFDRSAAVTSSRTFATKRGEWKNLVLADGSRVTLGPESQIVYLAAPNSGPRTVKLVGEALFTVAHNPHRPFTVRARNAVAEDVGTRFGVRAYVEDAAVRVVVEEGSVLLGDAASSLATRPVLSSGTLGVVSKTGMTAVTTGIDPDALLAWRDGRLVFHRTPLSEVVKDIGRRFDLDVRVADSSLGDVPISGSVPVNTPVAALDVVATVVHAHWQMRDRAVVLVPTTRERRRSSPATPSR
jgi:transmembrane sensor